MSIWCIKHVSKWILFANITVFIWGMNVWALRTLMQIIWATKWAKKYQFESMIGLFLLWSNDSLLQLQRQSTIRSRSLAPIFALSWRVLALARTHKNAIKSKRLDFGFSTLRMLCCGRSVGGVDYIRYEFIAES